MLTPSQRRIWIIASLIFVMFFIPQCSEFVSSPLYKIAERANEQHQQQETAYNIFAVMLRLNDFFTVFEKLFLVVSTIAIAFFTYTLWRATTGLFVMAKQQADDMRESLAIAATAANAAKESADAATRTIAIMEQTAKMTEKQIALVGMQVDNSIKQTTISREEFFATHRPKLILRAVSLELKKIPDYMSIRYTIANVGASPARIVEYNVKYCVAVHTELPPALTEEQGIAFNHNMEPGDWYTMPEYTDLPLRAVDELDAGKYDLFLIGQLTYRDDMERKRHLGFCRRLDPTIWRFTKLDNSGPYDDYEYSD